MDSSPHKPATPAATTGETWHQNGFNACEVVVIRKGPAPNGTRYADGRHQIRVALFECVEDAAAACLAHNAPLAPPTEPWDYMGFCG